MAFISLVITIVACGFVRDSNILNNKSKEEKIQFVYKTYINSLKNDLKKTGYYDKKNHEKISSLLSREYSFYIVEKNGNVIVSNNSDVKKIDEYKIKDGKRVVDTYKYNNAISKITICDYLKDGHYLYFVFTGYTTTTFPTEVATIFIFIISFTLLSLSRINYIIDIKKSIKVISHKDHSHRIPLKYRNELTELAENINRMASEIQKEDEKQKEFLTNVSHDLRTPLTSIIGYLSMIKDGKFEDEKELQYYLDKINRKSLFLKSMLDDFFKYFKLLSNDIQVNNQVIYLQELIRQLIEEEATFKNNNLKLSSSLDEEQINIKGDSELLVRAITNLLSNALKYSKADTVVEIKLFKEIIDKEVFAVIYVSNIPKEPISKDELEMFFERLYKKNKARTEAGSGLGLSIVKEIMKVNHGFIKGNIENQKVTFKLFMKNC
ncbi:HAMP domain-containing sensor histidine kinase [Clostridium estertheticum]|uniref:HAMP domain-containing sensor histidine kinase n=1 Tax=Clostridium estertheticum TaxID=238834 RepID=UPI001C0E17D9|nr:HAMP domain-containing sensor histidine kinase [Clostridium estertheticum]MBU3173519.1 HAMP domain-containing histidine kinase [Clostridium estertheticum]